MNAGTRRTPLCAYSSTVKHFLYLWRLVDLEINMPIKFMYLQNIPCNTPLFIILWFVVFLYSSSMNPVIYFLFVTNSRKEIQRTLINFKVIQEVKKKTITEIFRWLYVYIYEELTSIYVYMINTNHLWFLVEFTSGQYHEKCLGKLSLIWLDMNY